jgi:hypothetical protein
MSDIEIMEFPYGSFLKLRLEFVLLRDNELEAKIMRIIEGWMIEQKKAWLNECAQAASDGKPEPPEPDYFVTLSYAQIIAQLYMFNSSRKGEGKEVVEGKQNTISRRTVSKAMQALIDDKTIFTRPNPNATKEYDAIQYKLNCPLVQEQMKLLPKNPMSYLGSNGRVDGRPCENFAHPPCEKNSHPMQNGFTSPSENFAHGDVQKNHHLIDIVNRLSNRDTEEGTNADVSTTPSDASLSSTPSLSLLSDEDLLAHYEAEIARRKQATSPSDASSFAPSHAQSSSVSSQESTTSPQQNAKPAQQQSTPVDNSVDNQAGSEASHIVNETTPNTAPQVPTLSAEEQRIQGYWCELGFTERPSAKKHWCKLSKHVKGFEDFESLFKHVENEILKDSALGNKTVNPGNLANDKYLDGWKQSRRRETQKPAPTSPSKLTSVSGMRNYSIEPEVQPVITEILSEGKRKLPEFKLRRPNKTASVAQ